MALTREEVASNGLVLIGVDPISSFSDDNNEANTALLLYETVVRAALSVYPWSFARTTIQIFEDATAPLAGFSKSYTIPAQPEAIDLKRVLIADEPITYFRHGNKIMTNAAGDNDELFLDYSFRADEGDWNAAFRLWIEYRLAGHFAAAITRNAEMVVLYLGKDGDAGLAGGMFMLAKAADAKSQSARKVKLNRLTSRHQ